jgi:ribulose-5-phosphate 4-epimerase/fuculose-1-phosphate aldolase
MNIIKSDKKEIVKKRVGAVEWSLRQDLAACYRLVDHFGWDDGIFTHNSVRIPGDEDYFLLNPYGFLFKEITASNLVKIDLRGNIIDGGLLNSSAKIIDAGFTIHSAIHMSRHNAKCVMHTHTIAGMAVSAQKNGLLPLAQTSMRFYNRIAYHDYEGIANDLDERQRLVLNLGKVGAMILRNHGLLTVGRSISEAFSLMRYLQRACELQIAAQSTGEISLPSKEVCEKTALQFDKQSTNQHANDAAWDAFKRMLIIKDDSFLY